MTISALVDSNVLIDILGDKSVSQQREWSEARLHEAALAGPVCLSAVVWAEVSQFYRDERSLQLLLRAFSFTYEALPFSAAFPAGQAHRVYRERGGRRERTLPDFLIGAHALVGGHRLLTRDGSRYRDYFPDLDIIAPDSHP